MEELYDAVVDLNKSLLEQSRLQNETNDLMKALISTLQESAQATTDLKEVMEGYFENGADA